ncbi:MAG: hypothetical protein OEV37_00990 [Candidatus Berkelbacteria bacterium]|nr:hypothetical protein [Candidatus Berkelbacteria bacterium]
MIDKTCKQCHQKFVVEDDDLAFYKKISPTFAGKTFEIPPPTLCPECRLIRRMNWRNERKFYKNECSICKREIISVYSPDKKPKALCKDCFWSDKWNQHESERNYDINRSFFEQFDDLLHSTYLLTLFATNCENSEFVNQEMNSSNCYLCTGGNDNRNCFHCNSCIHGNDMTDCFGVGYSDKVHNSVFSVGCFDSQYLFNCHMCNDCLFCNDCVGCNSCFSSTNLRYKKYYFFNEELKKEEYLKRVKEYTDSYEGVMRAQAMSKKNKLRYPFKYVTVISCQGDCTGDIMLNSKDVKDSYYCYKTENARYVYMIDSMKEIMDALSIGRGELIYEGASSTKLYNSAFMTSCDSVRNSYYCYNCTNSNDLFGCVSLNRKKYCILNKQYSEEEYKIKVARIIEQMSKQGEWGEFFPTAISPFCYNESNAFEHFPIKKDKAKRLDLKWQDKDYSTKNAGPYYKPKDIKEYDIEYNPDANDEIEKCIKGIIKCEVSGKPFKIIPRELAQYIENKLQIPRKHPDVRYKERLDMFNKMNLYHRQCMCEETEHGHSSRCPNEFETTYAPDRPEKVYCESCYQKAVI